MSASRAASRRAPPFSRYRRSKPGTRQTSAPEAWPVFPYRPPGDQKKRRAALRNPRRLAPSASQSPPLHEPFVVTRDHMGLDLSDRIHRDADDDEKRGAA